MATPIPLFSNEKEIKTLTNSTIKISKDKYY